MFFHLTVIILCVMAVFAGARSMKAEQDIQEVDHKENTCLLGQDGGPCRGYFPSYFYDTKTSQCQQFIYGGCEGNANRFKTKDACVRKCATNSTCFAPVKQRSCYWPRYTIRYRYHAHTMQCKYFISTGCFANGNNFKTKADCVKRCGSGAGGQNICQLGQDGGPCRGYFPSYFYDTKTDQCQEFIYGGCEGNANRFKTKDACVRKCSVNPTGNSRSAVCHFPKLSGPCKGFFPRYYFNKKTRKCHGFVYGGCQGNDNNFKTIEACKQQCHEGNRTHEKKT